MKNRKSQKHKKVRIRISDDTVSVSSKYTHSPSKHKIMKAALKSKRVHVLKANTKQKNIRAVIAKASQTPDEFMKQKREEIRRSIKSL